MNHILYYFHDPMCSWCYAFQPVWAEIKSGLPDEVIVKGVVGGLAPDDDKPMPQSMQDYIQQCWQHIQEVVPGIEFNFDYWEKCEPRRSTYPACRAVIAATKQASEYEETMIHAIQKAYYQEAKNPSDLQTHIRIATELGLDVPAFEDDIISEHTNRELNRQVLFTKQSGVSGFPCLTLSIEDAFMHVPHDYNNAQIALDTIHELLANHALETG